MLAREKHFSLFLRSNNDEKMFKNIETRCQPGISGQQFHYFALFVKTI
jgi:hypothetical protein